MTEAAGLKGMGWGGDVAVFDYDEDGRLDLFVTNMFGRSQLYHNDGNGRFRDVTQETIGRTSWGAIGSKVFDFNNDGKLDLFVVDMHSDMWIPLGFDDSVIKMIEQNEHKKYKYVTGPAIDFNKTLAGQEKQFVDSLQVRYDEVVFGNTMFKNLGDGKF